MPRQTFANDTARIGSVNSQFWVGRWSQRRMASRVPSRRKNAYSRNPATTSGRTHAVMTTPPVSVRTGFDARCIRAARARPSVFWPSRDDTTVKTRVSHTALRNSSSAKALRKFARPTKEEWAWPVSWRSVKAIQAQ